MTFIPNERGKVSTLNSITLASSGGSQNTTSYSANSGTVVSATSTTVVLDAGASVSDDTYNNLVIEIITGPGRNKATLITDYVGSTKTATVSEWVIIPDSTSEYVIHQNSGIAQTNTTANTTTNIVLSSTSASSVDDFYNQSFIKLFNPLFQAEIRHILDYTGSTKVAVIDTGWNILPDNTTLYAVYGESGTSQSGSTSNTIVLDGNQSTIAGTEFLYIDVLTGTGAGQIRQIVNISTNTLTITPNWDITPVSGDTYNIFGGWGGTYEEVSNFSLITFVGTFGTSLGERSIVDLQLTLDSSGTERRGKYAESSVVEPSTVHTLTVVSKFFRLKFIDIDAGINGQLQCIYNSYKSGKLTSFIGEPINDNNDCELTRAVLTGKLENETYRNVAIDAASGGLYTRIISPLSAFGEVLVAQSSPVFQTNFTYGISTLQTEQFLSHGTIVAMGVEGSVGVAQVQSIYVPKADSYTSSGAADYFTLEDGGGNAFYIWYSIGTSSDPTPGGTAIPVTITAGQTPSQVGSATSIAVNANGAFSTSLFENIVTITNATSSDSNPTSIDAQNMPATSGSTLTSVKGSSLASATTGTGIADYSVLRSIETIRYRSGMGTNCRFTAIYDTGTAGTWQFAGLANSSSALFMGYKETQFEIFIRTRGLHQIQTFQVTSVASATTGTIIITINGIDFTITLTDVSTVQVVAQAIASQDYTTNQFLTDIVNDTAFISSELVNSTQGAHSFGFALGTATNISVTVSEVTGGQALSDTDIVQENWNKDRLDGNGPSGMVFNPQKGNVFQIAFQWLGFGAITFSIEDSNNGFFIPFHTVRFTNTSIQTSLSQPNVQFTSFTTTTTGVSPVTLQIGSISGFIQGIITHIEPNFSESNTLLNISNGYTNSIIMALKSNRFYNGLANQVEAIIKSISIASTKSANNTKAAIVVNLIFDGTPSTDLVFNYIDELNTPISVAKPSLDGATLTGGSHVVTGAVGAEGTEFLSIFDQSIDINHNSVLYITHTNAAVANGNVDLTAAVDWVEDH